MINKFYNNRIALLILSLFLSILMFVYVKAEQYSENPVSFFQNVSEATTETIYNVPVYIDGNVDAYYVTGLPDSVSVSLSGPKNLIEQTLEADDFRVITEDLTDLGEGSHYIQLQLENVSEAVSYEISPSSVNISIDSLQTTEYPVQVEMSNESAVADGYEITDVSLSQDSVTLTGSTSDIESVSQVYTVVNIPDNLSEDYTTTATVITENADGDILNINTDPSEVDVTVQVSPEGVSVPIVANITNEREGYTYEATILDSQNATLSGDYDTINNTESVSATVDVSGIITTTTVDAPIVLPDGVTSSDPSNVRVQVVPTATESSSSSSASSSASSESDEDSASSDTASSEESATSSESGTSGNESTIEEDTTSDSDISDSTSSSTSEVGVTTGVSNNLQNGNGNVQADQINSTSSESVSSSSSANVFNGILAFLASFS
ncbi:YbbR-like domain-containing protein [Aerococcus urinaeequi]|uniref:CdaR family protein n=1 Tax=Aerococcus urinaeequi TaxID=51665 RepID=UPI00288F757C|nr:CdaR family protein [Aerococcus urinaeequi]MDT2762342.1 CdaR family protein [Aerococcus urinaeequi]